MSEIPKWKTKKFTIVGWIWISLLVQIGLIDLYLNFDGKIIKAFSWWPIQELPTLSQYVQWRYADQTLFGVVIIGFLVWLGLHFFAKKK